MRLAFPTPEFSPTDPIVCRRISLRPSLWSVVFTVLEQLSEPYSWRQVEVGSATPDETAAEMEKATDSAVVGNCIMIGQIIELVVDAPPTWMLRCDGAVYLIADYPELAAVIHPSFVISGTQFRVPDRDNRIALDGVLIASQGGANTHMLTVDEMPSHTHQYDKITATLIDAGVTPTVIGIDDINAAPTGATGGGAAHNNMQQYEGSAFYIIARFP